METMNTEETALCAVCHIEMERKQPEIGDLDINKLSLLAMFSVRPYVVLQCPGCHNTGIYI